MAPLGRSQRLRYYDDVREGLRDRTFEEMRVLLRTFGLDPMNPYDSWDGGFETPSEYLLVHLPDLDDEALIELRSHVGSKVEGDLLQWGEEGPLRVFLSHLAKEKEYVADFKLALERYGLVSFVAHEDIHLSAAWREAIEAHLSTADMLIAFVHPGFFDSQWTDQEVGWALGRDLPIVSLLFDSGTPLRGFMASRQAILVGTKSVSSICRELVLGLAKGPMSRRLRAALIHRLLSARNFAEARDVAVLLNSHFGRLTVEEADRLATARAENDQLQRGYREGVSAIRALLENAETAPAEAVVGEEPF